MTATMTMPAPVATVLAGGTLDPDAFVYGTTDPQFALDPGTLYINTTTMGVWAYGSGAACDASVDSSTQGGAITWSQIADFTNYIPRVQLLSTVGEPLRKDIRFPQGNEYNDAFLFKGLCWTPSRPELNGVPIPDPDPANPLAVGTLPVPWVEKYWLSEIRDTYVSSIRYYNGWVPWYGTRPDWVWYDAHSRKGVFEVTAEWDPIEMGTLVRIKLHSRVSFSIRPSKSYHWDLESASAAEYDDDGFPDKFEAIKTWVKGRAIVDPTSTMLQT